VKIVHPLLFALPVLTLVASCATPVARSPQMTAIHVENHTLEYVALSITFQVGAAKDPAGKEGLAHLAANMLLRGTAKYSREALAEELDYVGTSFGINVGRETTQIFVDCSTRNLPQLVELVAEVLAAPTFPEDEFQKLKRQTVAELSEMRDSDADAARLFFSELLFEGHPYAHPTRGYEKTINSITREEAENFYRQNFSQANILIGVAGDVAPDAVANVRGQLMVGLPVGNALESTPEVPSFEPGLRVLLVTREDRSQAQVAIGQTALRGDSSDLFPASVAVTGFGGTFTSILVREIREKRGWSYGVGAALVPGRHTGLFQIRYAPSTEDVVPAIQLTEELLVDLATNGLAAEHIEFAQSYMASQYPFLLDTPHKRLAMALDVILANKPEDYVENYVKYVESVTVDGAKAALNRLLRPGDLAVVVVGDAALAESLSALPGVTSFRQISATWDGPLPAATE
jgi:zinc protease